MNVLEFIFGIIVVLISAFVVIGTVCTIYDYKRVEKENNKLKEDLQKARQRKIKNKEDK